MCANYTPVTEKERLKFFFSVAPNGVFPDETWPGYAAPFLRQARDSEHHEREAGIGLFGIIPHWAKDLTIGRKTYNARSETVSEKPSFRDAWRFGRRCINADGHDVMKYFHKPEDEKRMVVILDEADYDAWLDAPQDRMRDFLTPYPTERLESTPSPRERKPATKK